MTTVGFLGSGGIGLTVAQHAVEAGHQTVPSSERSSPSAMVAAAVARASGSVMKRMSPCAMKHLR